MVGILKTVTVEQEFYSNALSKSKSRALLFLLSMAYLTRNLYYFIPFATQELKLFDSLKQDAPSLMTVNLSVDCNVIF